MHDIVTTRLGDLVCRVVSGGAMDAASLAVVLCHGYGAPGTDLVGIGGEILRARPDFAGKVAFFFPEAPHVAEANPMDGRAWWQINILELEQIARSEPRRLSTETPDGMPEARRRLMALVDDVASKTGLGTGQIALGGFSQGSMLATDVALRLEEAPAFLSIFSGTLLTEDQWARRAQGRAGLRVLQSHGRQDPLLPFAAAERLRDLLSEAGLVVDFIPFFGGHTIPQEALMKLMDEIEGALTRG